MTPKPQPPADKKTDEIFIGHGIEDLDPEEQEKYRKSVQRLVVHVPQKPEIDQRIVRVPTKDYLGEGLLQALAAEAKNNENLQGFVDRVVKMGKHIGKSEMTADRIKGVSPYENVVVE